jgi:hypothetical protein
MAWGNFYLLGTLAATLLTAGDIGQNQRWVGVWQGELDGVPGVTVTLGNDNGDLEGTIVFNVVARDGGPAQVIGHDAHVLIRVRLEEDTLAFQVIRFRDGKDLHLTMRLKGDHRAQLECADCGGPPATELMRIK